MAELRTRRRSPRGSCGWAALVALSLLACGGDPRAGGPPDVILITLDTTRADHLGLYGYEPDTSPELDRFAGESVVYRRAWSTSPWTLPAHATLFTGRHPTSHGAHFNAGAGDARLSEVLRGEGPAERRAADQVKVNRLADQAVTLAELLRDAGYTTAAFTGGPWLTPPFGLLQGYEVVDADVQSLGGRRASELSDAASSWLASLPRGRRLHLLVNYFDPHSPYDPPEDSDPPMAPAPIHIDAPRVNRGGQLTEEQRAAYVARYDAEIRYMDRHLGRLLAALRSLERYDASLIIVTSDHGETFGEHGLMEHGRWLYEEVLRVPLIVHFPGGEGAGTSVDAPVSLVDLLPLIAAEVGLELPDEVEGVPVGERELVLAESFRDALAIRAWGERFDRDLVAAVRWPWKLILSDTGEAELYQLGRDPGELRNRAGEEEEGAELGRALARAHAALRAPGKSSPAEASGRLREQLRALGYID